MPTTPSPPGLALPLRLLAQTVRAVPRPVRQLFYRSPIFGTIIQRLLARSTPGEPVEVLVASGALRGTRLRLNLRAERDYWLGTYERRLIPAIADFCRAGMVAYDLGANIGYTALAFARAAGDTGQVYAFEPLADNTRRIAEHVALNGLQAIVRLIPCAVSDREGLVGFSVHRSHLQGRLASTGAAADRAGQIAVPSIRLDDFVYRDQHPPPDIMKIDIEGGAASAILGMTRILQDRRPIVFIEIHDAAEQQAVWEALRRGGYRAHRLQPSYPQIANLDAHSEPWPYHLIALPA